jgi:hypothetical protein
MKIAPKEYWIDEFKSNSAITKVVWKNRFDKGSNNTKKS